MNSPMTLSDLIRIQSEFDKLHGFKIPKSDPRKKYHQVSRDLIGLFGEIGEMSNIIKKINLHIDYSDNLDNEFIKNKEIDLKEEMIDILIYFVRLTEALDIDLETEFLNKLAKNETKYSNFKG
jgi:NTP pyrophosphatase (non-canonical NTP hydrolase)